MDPTAVHDASPPKVYTASSMLKQFGAKPSADSARSPQSSLSDSEEASALSSPFTPQARWSNDLFSSPGKAFDMKRKFLPQEDESPGNESITSAPSLPTMDRRTASGKNLRNRNSLSLSAKAKANVARGFRDPRESVSLPPSPTKKRISSSGRGLRTGRVNVGCSNRRNAFLMAYGDLFENLLPKVNFVSKLRTLLAESPTGLGISNLGDSTTAQDDEVPFKRLSEQPAGLRATLKGYQLEGLSFLSWMHQNDASGILADEMGLGKTIQTLSLLQHIKEIRPTGHNVHLIVCPLTVLDVWISEAARFTPKLGIVRFHGSQEERDRLKGQIRSQLRRYATTCDAILTTYEVYERESCWLNGLTQYCWAILDEGHRIKNAKTHTAQSLLKVKANKRLIITGTPLHNNMLELWSLLHWLYPEVFKEDTSELFHASFALGHETKLDAKVIADSRRLLELIMLRRTKDDVSLHLPPLKEIALRAPITPLQRQVYLGLLDTGTKATKAGSSYSSLLNILVQLRQVSVHPYLLDAALPDPYVPGLHIIENSGKFIILRSLLNHLVHEKGEKVIIFSTFTKALDYTEEMLSFMFNGQYEHVRIDGSVARARRNLMTRLFQDKSSNYRVILVSIRSGGVGLTLTAASTAIFLDEDFNPQITLQATARAHRIGQENPVTIYKLYSQGTVEEQILSRISKKLALSSRVMDDFATSALATKGTTATQSPPSRNMTDSVLTVSEIANILSNAIESLLGPRFKTEELLTWSLEEIMSHFQIKPLDHSVADLMEAEDVFAGSAVTDTRLFEGVKHQPNISVDDVPSSLNELDRGSRRIGKNTTVLVDDVYVSKASTFCLNGEAVPTLAGKDSTLKDRPRASRLSFEHEGHCTLCGEPGDDKDLVPCADCPHSMHKSCADEDEHCIESGVGSQIRCPMHACAVCKAKTDEAGGLLYRCTLCNRARCESHVDFEKTVLEPGFVFEEWEALGFGEKAGWFWTTCQKCSTGGEEPAWMDGEAAEQENAVDPRTPENSLQRFREQRQVMSTT